jgi:hypothetical protein
MVMFSHIVALMTTSAEDYNPLRYPQEEGQG